MKVLVVDDDKSLAARLTMMIAAAGIDASMLDDIPVKRKTYACAHIRHQGARETTRRLAALKAREGREG